VGYVIETMSRAIFAAKLAEMPQNIEEVFTANGLSLFPLHWLISAANAPAKPTCKHIGAIYYQLGDPSAKTRLLFLRGVALKTNHRRYANCGLLALKPNLETPFKKRPNPISSKIDSFWQYNEPLESALLLRHRLLVKQF